VYSARAIDVLLVEDDAGDVYLTSEGLAASTVQSQVHVVRDGVEALQFLRREPPYEGVVRPDLIILDLNLPRMSGRELLAEVKTDPLLRAIPVVVLTTSTSNVDITKAYELHANLYVHKPTRLDDYLSVVQQVEDFFERVVRLPRC